MAIGSFVLDETPAAAAPALPAPDFIALLGRRRSIRRLEGGSLAESTLQRLQEAVLRTPSAFGITPWHVVIVHERRHDFWREVEQGFRAGLEGGRRQRYLDRLDGFRGGSAVVLIFEDRAAFPVLRDGWTLSDEVATAFVQQGLGMVQLAIWHLVPSAAVYLGIAQAARDDAVAYAKDRRPNGMSGSIAELQSVQHKIAEMELLLLQARTLLYTTAEQWIMAPHTRPAIGWHLIAAKYTVTNAALRVTDLALRVAGSAGLSSESPLQRYFRDARTALGHPPMEDAVLTTIGKAALGLTTAQPPAVAPPAPRREAAGVA